jgi:cytochrome c oxidase subunit 4
MNITEPTPEEAHGEVYPVGDAVIHAHPGGAEYVRVAVALAVITAIEVAIYYLDLNKLTLITGLIGLSITKFTLVAMFFMHLKFDSRVFTAFFAGGLLMTIAAFIAVLSMFRVF